ncbi:MAG: hypothetical protein JNM19_04245 [Chitinophagaceae bacterium]|nr:hypothetical protein [Chitinophagaceae bacterium]
MKLLKLTIALSLLAQQVTGQSFSATASPAVSVEKGTTYMNLLHTEGGDVYSLKHLNNIKKSGITYSICKFNASMTPVYETSLNKLIGDRFFEGVHSLKGRIYLFTSDYREKKKKYVLFGIELDKATGNPVGTEKTVQEYERHTNWDEYTLRILPDADSSRFIITGVNDNKEDDIFYVTVTDPDLNTQAFVKADPRIPETQHYKLQDVLVESNNNVTLAGQHFDIVRNAKGVTWQPKGYHLFRFDSKGKKINDTYFKIENKFPAEIKLYKINQSLVLAGTFYEDEAKPAIKGCFLARLNPENLSTAAISFQAFTADQLFNRDLDASFAGLGSFYFHHVVYHPGLQKFYFFAENFHVGLTADTYFYQLVTYGGEGGVSRKTDSWKNADTYTYHCGDILVMEANASDLQVNRHYLVPKRQLERLTENLETGYPGIRDAAWNKQPNEYLFPLTAAPLYSSYGLHWVNDKIYLLYNEQPRKKESAQDKDFVLAFKNTPLTAAVLDLKSGTVTNLKLKDNEPAMVYMPRFILSGVNKIYVPSLQISPKVDCNFKLTCFKQVP